MKICWDNLEEITYIKKSGTFRYRNHTLYYYDSCITCKEPFLGQKGGKYCCGSCVNTSEDDRETRRLRFSGKNNGMYGRTGSNHPKWKGGVTEKNIPLYDTFAHQLEPYEECRRQEEDPNILEVKCTYCGIWFTPKTGEVNNRIGGINSNGGGRFYHLEECKQECPIYYRHKYHKGQTGYNSREVQPQLRQLVFARDNYICQRCGSTKSLHCHHIDPVVSNPIESADVDNSITLCKDCHKWVHMNIPGCGYGALAGC